MIRDVSVNVAYTESTVVTNIVRKDCVLLPFAYQLESSVSNANVCDPIAIPNFAGKKNPFVS